MQHRVNKSPAFNHAGVRQLQLDKVKTQHFEAVREYLIASQNTAKKLMAEQKEKMKRRDAAGASGCEGDSVQKPEDREGAQRARGEIMPKKCR